MLGDNVTLYHAAEGVEASVARAELGEWRAAVAELQERQSDDFGERYRELEQSRDAFVMQDRIGFVWLLRQR